MKTLKFNSVVLTGLFFTAAFFISNSSSAQDKVYKPSGEVIEGKILEVSEKEIKYRKASLPDGPVYTASISDVLMIVYENGEHEIFSGKPDEKESTVPEKADEPSVIKAAFKRQRVMGLDFFQHYYGNVSFFIERIKSPVYANRFSFYVSYKDKDDRKAFPIEYGFSVNPKFFVYYHEKVRCFLGQSFHYGASRETATAGYSYRDNYPYGYYSEETETRWNWHESSMLETGVSINPVRQLDITLSGGFGYVSTIGLTGSDNVNYDIDMAWKVGITIGGKF